MTTILPQLEAQLSDAASRRARRLPAATGVGHRRLLVAMPVVLAAMLISLALGGGTRRFDVAAAVYEAVTPGTGVQYVDVETEDIHGNARTINRFQRWRTISPRRERTISTRPPTGAHKRPLVLEGAITAGGGWKYWSSAQPNHVALTDGKSRSNLLDESVIRAAYRAGALRSAGTGRLGGRELDRLEVVHNGSEKGTPPVELLVDPHTFVPVELTQYLRDASGRLVPGFISRYQAYEELPITASSLELLKMAAHPGA